MVSSSTIEISDYHIIKTLGAGTTGKVKLARHPHTHELVALKIIRKDLLDRKRNIFTKVRREIAIMKLIAGNCLAAKKRILDLVATLPEPLPDLHIGVMKLLDVYDTENSFVLVLEYCDGGELFDVLVENGRLPEDQVLDLFQQLVYALEFCHRRGICHRDLKPENVLLTSDGRVKLADFGMASLLTPGSLLETSCGSPQYCAPEVIRGEPYAGSPADVWSLGVVLYAMTTGGLPFNDDNLHRLVTKINSGAFYMPAEVPDELASLMQSMLTVDPAGRATLEEIKRSDWFSSQPCRQDIYKEDDDEFANIFPFLDDTPITEPDRAILRYLRDLGLGDDPTIRRRLRSPETSLERSFYYQLLELCVESLAFRPAEDVPLSPKNSQPASPKQPKGVEEPQDAIKNRDTVAKQVAGHKSEEVTERRKPPAPPPDTVRPAWLQHLAIVFPWESQRGRATAGHHLSSTNTLPSIPALHSVPSR